MRILRVNCEHSSLTLMMNLTTPTNCGPHRSADRSRRGIDRAVGDGDVTVGGQKNATRVELWRRRECGDDALKRNDRARRADEPYHPHQLRTSS